MITAKMTGDWKGVSGKFRFMASKGVKQWSEELSGAMADSFYSAVYGNWNYQVFPFPPIVIGGTRWWGEGELMGLLTVNKASKSVYQVGFDNSSVHSSGIMASKLALWLEYGTIKQPPRPLFQMTYQQWRNDPHGPRGVIKIFDGELIQGWKAFGLNRLVRLAKFRLVHQSKAGIKRVVANKQGSIR